MKVIDEVISTMNNVIDQEHCDKHDQTYNLIETPGGVVGSCPDCWKELIKNEDRQFAERAIENKKGWQASYISRFERVSSDLKGAKVSNYKPKHETQEQARKLAIEYVNKFNKENSLVLSGRPGVGKSHLAYAITKALRQREFKTLFIKSTELLDLFKSTFNEGSQLTEERIFKLIESVDLLVIDDLGREYVKPNEYGHESWASDMLFKVYDSRLNKAVITTTNYVVDELERKYGNNGEPIISRVLQGAKSLRIHGEDNRRKNRF